MSAKAKAGKDLPKKAPLPKPPTKAQTASAPKAAAAKKEDSKEVKNSKSAKTAPTSSPAVAKGAKKPKADAEVVELKEELPAQAVTGENGEEGQDEDDLELAASNSAANGNAAAIAAAGGSEMSASFKNFRHHPDMENFYRFIYENDLRLEALEIIEQVMTEKRNRRAQQKPAAPGKAVQK